MTDVYRIYWDSDVVIAFLSAEKGRISALRVILKEVEDSNGKRKIIASQISKVEVAFTESEKREKVAKREVEERIDTFWGDDSVIELVELGENITIRARDLIRKGISKGWKGLKPLDAIHLATAIYADVKEFHTYNVSHFEPYKPAVSFTIMEPAPTQSRLDL